MNTAEVLNDEADLVARLQEVVSRQVRLSGDVVRLAMACPRKRVADDPLKLLVSRPNRKVLGVLKCSPAIRPDFVAREMQIARDARRLLGEPLGGVVLQPLAEGEIDGRSYVLLPYCRKLSDFRWIRDLQARWFRRAILDWLFDATRASVHLVPADHIKTAFRRPLQAMVRNGRFGPHIREEAARALDQIDRGVWQPKYVLAHNDFWIGNILLRARGATHRFAVIDWGGASSDGYALYDLLCVARTLKLSNRSLHGEVARHCDALGMTLTGAKWNLLAGLGHLGTHLHHFPEDRYIARAQSCWEQVVNIENCRAL